MSGWATINFNELQNENSTYSTGPLNLEESSLVVSVENIGGFIGNFAILPLIQIVGVKRMIHFLGLPLIVRAVLLYFCIFQMHCTSVFFKKKNYSALQVSSLLIIWAQNVYYLYASRLLSGLASGALVIGISTLINEISNNK